jgi:hypothetical protein
MLAEQSTMANWRDLEDSAPDLAAAGRERFTRSELVLVGSLRRDGSPRISPCEPDIVDGELMLGMMWRSTKARDLLRDPRCVVHSTVHHRMDAMGEFKVRGRAVEVQDAHRRERYCRALFDRIAWSPPGDFHLFAIDIESATHIYYADERQRGTMWTPAGGLRTWEKAP